MGLPIEVCDRCGIRGEVIHIGDRAVCPGHETHWSLAEEIERLRTVVSNPENNPRVVAEAVRTALHLASGYLIAEKTMPSIVQAVTHPHEAAEAEGSDDE